MKVQAIIPARLSSERLANKVLLEIAGKPMVIHIYETLKNCSALSDVCIATEDIEIAEAADIFGAKCIMTGKCSSGTQRVIEAYAQCEQADLLINVQGDEPLVNCSHIESLIQVFKDQPEAGIATLIEPFTDYEELSDPNNVKVVLSDTGKAIYFSRSIIPNANQLHDFHYKHVGIYAFKSHIVKNLESIPRSQLSQQERLEQLDWLVAELAIYTAKIDGKLIGVDTEADLIKVRQILEG